MLQAASTTGTAPELRKAVDDVRAAVDAAIESSEDLKRWEAMRLATEYDRLRQRYEGKVVHAVGGLPQDATIVIMTDFMSQAIAGSARDKCRRAGIEWYFGKASVRGVLEALDA